VRKTTSHKKNWLQRLKYYKPLFPISNQNKSSWKVKTFTVGISNNKKLIIKLRRFKTHPNNRSNRFKQVVVGCKLLRIKEVVIILVNKKNKNTKEKNIKEKLTLLASRSLIIVGLLGLSIFSYQIMNFSSYNPPYVSASPVITGGSEIDEAKGLSRSEPINISIPSINVQTGIHEVGLLENGSLETPQVMSGLVGWYEKSPTPGEIGPSVLVGHVDTYKGPSVFWNLGNLQNGDVIQIARVDNSIVEFIVTKKVVYDQSFFGTDEVYGNIEYAGLRVITCGGAYNHITGRYSHNTVIFAEVNKKPKTTNDI
jgi:sortase (surface protein transpeptidase)